jgi:hypothetical protein
MTEATTDFPFEQLQGWDQTEANRGATPPSEIALALLAWLVPAGSYSHTIKARAVAMRFVVDPASMGNPTMAQAADLAGISRPQFVYYVYQFENLFRIHTRQSKRRRCIGPYTAPH